MRYRSKLVATRGWCGMIILLLIGMVLLAACCPVVEIPTPPTPTIYQAPETPAAAAQPPAPLPTLRAQSGATSVLLLGTDRRGSESQNNNTDTLMLFHLDANARRIAILSIPRDLYVEIPGHGQGRVNTAYALGQQDGTGGLTLARRTVSVILGIPVQHAALIDFEVFVTIVDAIGGVDVDVPHAISDPTYPDGGTGYDPFYLSAGQHHLDGATALRYARTRATPAGDFDRIARQRQVVLAMRDQVMRLDLLPELIAQSPQLWSALQGAFETDLTLGQMVDLAVIAGRVPTEQIAHAGIDETCTQYWTTPGGASVLLPDRVRIDAVVDELFSAPATAASAH